MHFKAQGRKNKKNPPGKNSSPMIKYFSKFSQKKLYLYFGI